MADSFETRLQQAHDSIAGRWSGKPRFGIVLGTGAGEIAEEIDAEVTLPYESIANFPHSTATGHKGNLVCGKLVGQDVVAMQGRFHLFEGYAFDDATLPIHVMHRMGVEVLFVSNAAGGLNPKMKCGDLMAIRSHLDFLNRSTVVGFPRDVAGRPALRADDALDSDLIEGAQAIARDGGFVLSEGVYAAMLGPTYETRAEVRCLRTLGADAAGMSTVPEVTVASKYSMRALAVSIITNIPNPDVLVETDGEDVVQAGQMAAPKLTRIVKDTIARIVASEA